MHRFGSYINLDIGYHRLERENTSTRIRPGGLARRAVRPGRRARVLLSAARPVIPQLVMK